MKNFPALRVLVVEGELLIRMNKPFDLHDLAPLLMKAHAAEGH